MLASPPHPEAGMEERLGVIERVANAGRAWRRATFTLLGLGGLSLLVHVYAFSRPGEKFAVIEIDTCGGQSRVVGPLPTHLSFRQVAINRVLQDFVLDLRGISTDIEITKAQWRRLRDQVTPEGAQLLLQTEVEAQPLARRDSVVVKIIRVQAREPTRYDVRWQENRYSPKGELVEGKVYGGLFTFEWGTPREAAPLGMFFRQWQVGPER
jgi:type IV secretory pathway TrbF-like protein